MKDSAQRIISYLDSQHLGFLADVDVEEVLRELCEKYLAEKVEEPEEFDYILGLDDTEVKRLLAMLTRKEGVDGPKEFELRAKIVDEFNAHIEDTDIPF